MNKLYYIYILLLVLCSAIGARAQTAGTGVVVHTDPRLAVVVRKHHNTAPIHSGQGYRVQIYSGSDRNKANEIKIDFIKHFPGVHTYMTYVSPHFRIKVGDYRSRQEAQKMFDQVKDRYNPCMIVPDIIVVNTLKDD